MSKRTATMVNNSVTVVLDHPVYEPLVKRLKTGSVTCLPSRESMIRQYTTSIISEYTGIDTSSITNDLIKDKLHELKKFTEDKLDYLSEVSKVQHSVLYIGVIPNHHDVEADKIVLKILYSKIIKALEYINELIRTK